MAKWTVADIPSQSGRIALVTGANSGIGWNTALELARAGGEVVMTARTEAKGQDAVARIRKELPAAKVRFEILDLASLRSVREFATRISSAGKLDLLVNNAGVMRIPVRQTTEDGFETQFGTNFIGPFALTLLLMPALLKSAAPRVTTVSSGAAKLGLKRIRFEDMQWVNGYMPWNAYCQSKLADLMLTTELARRSVEAGKPVLSTAAHPGYARTNLQTSGPGRALNGVENFVQNRISQDSAHGALPTLRAATETGLAQMSYFGPSGMFELTGDPVAIPMPKTVRSEDARRLWDMATEMTGVRW
ncbi:oxidoreductase [Tunturiibacter lichenicola]|uniref:oxidoreductase n=1 Tax=Tunturiibacter lichenicola TaxID=2051959 RepID=UPI0021B3D046|nr:oxidoreductase [Edaphobacter lichenicola]